MDHKAAEAKNSRESKYSDSEADVGSGRHITRRSSNSSLLWY